MPVLSKQGYDFGGWSYQGIKLTDESGDSFTNWSIDDNVTLTPIWTVKSYAVSTTVNNSYYGAVTGAGEYEFESQVTLAATPRLGYCFNGWYNGSQFLSDSSEYKFAMPSESLSITARFQIMEEMQNLNFSSTESACKVTGIKDKSVTSIVIPSFVTEIASGILAGCNNLVSLTIPFVGQRPYAQLSVGYLDDPNSCYFFGHLFASYTNSGADLEITPTLRDGSNGLRYYMPSTLKSVTILGGTIRHGAMSNCTSLTSVTIGKDVTNIGIGAFKGCSNLSSVTFENQENWALNDSGIDNGRYTSFTSMADTALNASRLTTEYSDKVWFLI